MDKDEREQVIAQAEGQGTGEKTGNDLPVLLPEPEVFKLGEREYTLLPLKLNEMRVLVELAQISLTKIDGETLDKVVSLVSRLLKEPDTKFLEETMDMPTLLRFFNILQEVNYRGIPKARGPQKGN